MLAKLGHKPRSLTLSMDLLLVLGGSRAPPDLEQQPWLNFQCRCYLCVIAYRRTGQTPRHQHHTCLLDLVWDQAPPNMALWLHSPSYCAAERQ